VILNERSLAAYISRMRTGRTLSKALEIPRQTIGTHPRTRRRGLAKGEGLAKAARPARNIRESESEHQVFDYRPELADPKKLI